MKIIETIGKFKIETIAVVVFIMTIFFVLTQDVSSAEFKETIKTVHAVTEKTPVGAFKFGDMFRDSMISVAFLTRRAPL